MNGTEWLDNRCMPAMPTLLAVHPYGDESVDLVANRTDHDGTERIVTLRLSPAQAVELARDLLSAASDHFYRMEYGQ